MKKTGNILFGILTGVVNMLIGSCGGVVAVESLKKEGLDQTKAHATAIAVILPLTVISAIMYIVRGNVTVSDSTVYIIPGLIGSVVGSIALKKIPKKLLGKAFSIFIIYAGIRMIIK